MGIKKPPPVKEELKGRACDHPIGKRIKVTNRKGKKFLECDRCGAFLKWL